MLIISRNMTSMRSPRYFRKDAKAEIEDTLDEQVDTELSGLEALGDFTEEEKQEYKDMLVKIDNLAKYEVKEAKEDKDGNFTVTIEVTPSDVYQTLEDNSTAVAQEMMDQGQGCKPGGCKYVPGSADPEYAEVDRW